MDEKKENSRENYDQSSDSLIPTEPTSSKGGKPYGESSKLSGKAWGRVWFKFFRLPFPIFFIVWNEFCERFSYYGMRAVLTLFLKNFLNFEDDTATAIYHAFIVMCYLTPVGGAIISDSCLGKYGTIVSLSIVYAIGNVMMSVSAIPFESSRGANIGLTAVSLLIIAVGTGGIKPCVAAFGGDQFGKDKIDLLPVFFSVFYFSINAGSVLSTILTPILRSYVQCFGEDTCFPLAFGVPAALMIVSLVIFIFGTRWYLITRPKRESAFLFFQVPSAIVYAIYRRITLGRVPGVRNFMDYAAPRYSERFVFDVYLFLRVLVMLLPLPVFWALFDQQGSRWTLQAVRMDGRFGKYVIEPDQIQVLNPIFIIILIPVFETIVYPLCRRCHILHKPLQRMVVGMLLAGVAFTMAGLLEVYIQSSSDRLGKGESRVVVSNTFPDPVAMKFGNRDMVNVSESIRFNTKTRGLVNVTVYTVNGLVTTQQIDLQDSKQIAQIFVTSTEDSPLDIIYDAAKESYPDGDKASVSLFVADIGSLIPGEFDFALCEKKCKSISSGDFEEYNLTSNTYYSNVTEVSIGKYHYRIEAGDLIIEGSLPKQLGPGGIYTVVISLNSSGEGLSVTVSGANSPNEVSVLLQIPMYVTITAGEVLFSVTGLEFAYSQAPPSLKSLCQAAWLLTVAFGNLVVVIIAESSAFNNQAYEFFFFAAAITTVAIVFAVMSYFYKYVDPVKLTADQSGHGYDDPPSYTDDEGNSSYPENKTLLGSERSPFEDNPLSDIDSEDQQFKQRKTTEADETSEL